MQHITFVTKVCGFVTVDGTALQGDFTLQVSCTCVMCVFQVDNSDTVLQDRSVQSQSSMMFCNFCEWKDIQPRMIIKICFLHTERTLCQVKLFTTELRNLYREFQNSKNHRTSSLLQLWVS